MAQSKKTGGKAAKKGGTPPIALLALAGLGAYMLMGSSSDSSGSGSGTGSNYNPNGSGGSGALEPMSPSTPTSVQTSTPTSVPTSVPTTTPGSSGTIDRWGVPHFTAASVDWANGFSEQKGNLFKLLSDMYGLYATEIDLLMVYDQSVSGNGFEGIFNWYAAHPDFFIDLTNGYNAIHPSAPITRRIGSTTTTVPNTTVPSGPTTTGGGTTPPSGPFLDRWGVPHFTADSVDWANGFSDQKGSLFKGLSDMYGLYATEVDSLIVYDQSLNPQNSFEGIFNWYAANPGRFADLFAGYNASHYSNPITRRR
jgi:hypothetical protein